MDITIADTAHSSWYNNGMFETTVKRVTEFSDLYSVSVHSLCDVSAYGIPKMLIAWGFTRSEAEVPALTETLLASCELIYTNLKESQDAKR